jgi:hypothetical protein
MSVPIIEYIAADVLATVQLVTTGNGYNYDLTAERHKRSGDKRQHLNAVIVQEDPKELSPKVYFTKEWELPFGIGVFIIPDEADTTPIDNYCNVIRSDIEKALMVDRFRGGYALDTQIRASHSVIEEGGETIIVINVDVNYRTNELNPYQQA